MRNLITHNNFAVCVLCGLAVLVSGCQTSTHAGAGAVAGAGLGGTVGALLGANNGRAGTGALLGAMTGAMVGSIAGDAEDAREERDLAVAQAQYERDQAVARQSVTNLDLIAMAQAGLSDQVIVNAVQTRGGQFDLSPAAIIELKSRGVSENVILSIQRSSESSRPVASYSRPVTTIVAPPRAVYVVRPAPAFGVYVGARPHSGRYGHYHRHYGRW